jgi:hypothetical protein
MSLAEWVERNKWQRIAVPTVTIIKPRDAQAMQNLPDGMVIANRKRPLVIDGHWNSIANKTVRDFDIRMPAATSSKPRNLNYWRDTPAGFVHR